MMTQIPDDANTRHEALNLIAAQYVLGVLSASARTRFKARMLQEQDLRDLVYAWERRLNPLASMVAPEPVPPHLWQAIIEKIEQTGAANGSGIEQLLPNSSLPDPGKLPTPTDIRYRRWKTWAGFSTAVAAALALFIIFDPNGIVPLVHLPAGQTTTQTASPQMQDIAVLSSTDKTPAWIVRREQGKLLLLNLNAAAVPAQHDLELWTIQGNQPPQSLGILKLENGQASLSNIQASQLSKDSILAISLEPAGGSPTGAPTGAVLYSGNIVKAQG